MPVSNIAVMFDTLEPADAAGILRQMRPLKAGLVLKAMSSQERVFELLPRGFQSQILGVPGPLQIVHATIDRISTTSPTLNHIELNTWNSCTISISNPVKAVLKSFLRNK